MTTLFPLPPITGTAFDNGIFRIFKHPGLGHPFKFLEESSEDYMLIKDSGWWIETVEWVKNPYGNDLIGKWTGKSIYADKDTPQASNQWTYVDVLVTIGGVVPSTGGLVSLAKVDPPNACVPGGYYGDNYSDTFSFVTSPILLFMPGQFTKTTTVSVGTNAGNNYYISAFGGSTPDLSRSEVLTVWRRLWVESDTMQNAAGQLAGFPQISGLPEEQYARACIQLMPYSQPELSEIIATFEGVVVLEDPFSHSPVISSTLVSAVATQRHIPQPTKDFWTVHLVGSFHWLVRQRNKLLLP